MPITINKRIFITLVIIFGLISFGVSMVVNLYHPLPEEFLLEMKVKVIDRENLQYLYGRGNVTVIDCSPSRSEFDLNHRLPGAIWSLEPSMFKNTKHDLVVYSSDNEVSRKFCIELVRIVKTDVFLFRFGYPAWIYEGEE